jgi:TRAP-type C4-dicarboxylate transport system permease small subunit
VFLREENIVVDVIDRSVGPRGVDLLKRLTAVLAAVALGVMAWQGWIAAQDTLVFGDVTSDLSIPKIYYWIPLLAGLVGGLVSALFMAFTRSRKAP